MRMVKLPALELEESVEFWRLDRTVWASSWNEGEGARQFPGRWNVKGQRAVYCSLDPATAILEVAVHIGFRALDRDPRSMTCARLKNPKQIHVVHCSEVPEEGWLLPGAVVPEQQHFGGELLKEHGAILIPSVVSRSSWNLIFDADRVNGDDLEMVEQDAFLLDPRFLLSQAH